MIIHVLGVIHLLHGMVVGKTILSMMTAEEIWDELKRLGGDGFSFVTISGGNPALLKNLDSLIALIKRK